MPTLAVSSSHATRACARVPRRSIYTYRDLEPAQKDYVTPEYQARAPRHQTPTCMPQSQALSPSGPQHRKPETPPIVSSHLGISPTLHSHHDEPSQYLIAKVPVYRLSPLRFTICIRPSAAAEKCRSTTYTPPAVMHLPQLLQHPPGPGLRRAERLTSLQGSAAIEGSDTWISGVEMRLRGRCGELAMFS